MQKETIKANKVFGYRTDEGIDLGGYDKKGRRCGLKVTIVPVTIQADEDGEYYCFPEYVGEGFYVRAQPARGLNDIYFIPYGAAQPSLWFRTMAEVEAYVAKRTREAAKRYAKQFGWGVTQ